MKKRKILYDDVFTTNVCAVCGDYIKEGQKLGKRKSDDALCHSSCLYYEEIDNERKLCKIRLG